VLLGRDDVPENNVSDIIGSHPRPADSLLDHHGPERGRRQIFQAAAVIPDRSTNPAEHNDFACCRHLRLPSVDIAQSVSVPARLVIGLQPRHCGSRLASRTMGRPIGAGSGHCRASHLSAPARICRAPARSPSFRPPPGAAGATILRRPLAEPRREVRPPRVGFLLGPLQPNCRVGFFGFADIEARPGVTGGLTSAAMCPLEDNTKRASVPLSNRALR